MSTLLVDPGAVSGAAAFDTVAATQLGSATLASAPVITAVIPPGLDSTSVMAQMLVLQRTVQTLMMLFQFTGERAFRALAHDVAAGTYSATEAINAAAAMISG
ncbi:PE domain-containing protein [Mycolicibacterium mageritense]|uniref:PE domain-containing protein n=1 Tax=Mycolicibacterium mageritense TaxID=53462 RepID=UPI0011D31F58|nr:PE domain-containing protein [Mycolicibacterium mageritense]TXI55756.1 MAG: PE domain-containing protein [Mycolicibacterium mageritense]